MDRGNTSTRRTKAAFMPSGVTPRDYERLGLAQDEARADVIRKAAVRYVRSISATASHWMQDRLDQQLALLAFTTYRLLDPRRRVDAVQRIQLTFPLDRVEMEIPKLAANALFRKQRSPLRGKSDEESGQGEIQAEIVQLVDSAVSVANPSNLESNREIVRLIRTEKVEEPTMFSKMKKWFFTGSALLLGAVSLATASLMGSWSSRPPIQSEVARVEPIPQNVPKTVKDEAKHGKLILASAEEETPQDALASGTLVKENRGAPNPIESQDPMTESRQALAQLLRSWEENHPNEASKDESKIEVVESWLAESPKGTPDRYVLIEALARLCTRSQGLESGLRYCDQLESEFDRPVWSLRLELFEKHYMDGASVMAHRQSAEIGIRLCERAISAKELSIATEIIRLTIGVAHKSRDHLLKRTAVRMRSSLSNAAQSSS